MNKKRLWLIGQTIVAAGFVLFGFWRLLLVEPLLASAQEEPTVIREQRTVLRSSQPEPRWLELVRSRMDINPATVQASPISINLNLTDYFVAGRVPTLSPVMVQLLHQGMVLGSKEILPVPDITVAVYLRENRVAGQAPANSHLLVRIEKDYLTYLQPVMAGPDGVFEAGFDWAPDFTTISGSVLQYTDPASQTLLRYSTPIWKITLGNICVQGNGSLPSVPFTATLISASSGISQTYHATTSSSTGAYSACFGQPIHSGDRYSFTDPNYQSDDILPLVTAEHDFYRQVLEGTAWPDSEITVSFLGNPYPYIGGLYQEATRHTRSDASGAYGLDTSDLVLGPGQNAYIVTSDESGNQIVKFFRVTGYRQNFPFMAVEP